MPWAGGLLFWFLETHVIEGKLRMSYTISCWIAALHHLQDMRQVYILGPGQQRPKLPSANSWGLSVQFL